MKKWLVIWIFILILTWLIGIAGAAENNKSTFTGVYNVTFSTDQGQNYPAKIIIQDLKNGKVEVSGDYNGYPISIVGNVMGNSEDGGTICNFSVNKTGMAMGKAEITINMVDGEYKLSGSGLGSYSYGGTSGQISGKVAGNRKNSAASPQFLPFETAAAAGVVAALIAIIVYITWLYRKRKSLSIDKVLNARVLKGRKAAVYLANYGYLFEQGDGQYKFTKSGRALIQGKAGSAGEVLQLVYEGDTDDFVDINIIAMVVSRNYNQEFWD